MFAVSCWFRLVLTVLTVTVLGSTVGAASAVDGMAGPASASGSAEGTSPTAAVDGDRFSVARQSLWQGSSESAYWQMAFTEPRRIGAILQIHGDDAEVFDEP